MDGSEGFTRKAFLQRSGAAGAAMLSRRVGVGDGADRGAPAGTAGAATPRSATS